MGGKAGSIGSIVLGVIIIATGYYNPGAWVAGLSLIAGGAVGLAFAPKVDSQQGAQAQELQVATASLGNPVPVVFGPQRVTPNFIDYLPESFEAREVRGESEGGKGGGSPPAPVVGHDYYLRFELAWCMGPVDYVRQVWSMPGEVAMVDNESNEWVPWTDDEMDLALEGDEAVGTARIYRGSGAQTRISSGDAFFAKGMNYRNVCFASFGVGLPTITYPALGFLIGRQPRVKTYQAELLRLPKCLRDDGSTVTAIHQRGSADTEDPAYWYANPAAVIYEMATNKVWGGGMPTDLIDEDSFAEAADAYRDRNVGVAFQMLTADALPNYLDGLQRQVKSLLYWDGDSYKLRCLLDIQATHGAIQTLKESEIVEFEFTRPAWSGTTNEVRAEYLSEARQFRTDVVAVQDLANQQIAGGRINPVRIQLSAIPDFNGAQRQALRILSESSYPLMTATWRMNRFKSQVQVGEVVRIVCNDFTDDPVTVYLMVVDVEAGGPEDEMIRVVGIEDTLLPPVEGEETEVVLPSQYPWEVLAGLDVDDVDLHEPPPGPAVALEPIRAFEIPAVATGGVENRLLIAARRNASGLVGILGLYARPGSEFESMGSQPSFGVSGELLDAMPAGAYVDRTAAGVELELTDEGDGIVLDEVQHVDTAEEHLEALALLRQSYVIVGEEIMKVGFAEQVSGSTYRLRNIIRGQFGTPVQSHGAGATVFYFAGYQPGLRAEILPVNTVLDFRGYPIRVSGVSAVGDSFRLGYQDPELDEKFLGLGTRPLPPEAHSAAVGAGVSLVSLRPRFFHAGAGWLDDFVEELGRPVASLGGMAFGYREVKADGTTVQSVPVVAPHTFTPPTAGDPNSGLCVIEVPDNATETVTKFRLYSQIGGAWSAYFAEIPKPT